MKLSNLTKIVQKVIDLLDADSNDVTRAVNILKQVIIITELTGLDEEVNKGLDKITNEIQKALEIEDISQDEMNAVFLKNEALIEELKEKVLNTII